MNFQYTFPTIIGYSEENDVAKLTLEVAKEYLNNDKFVNNSYGYKTTFGTQLNDDFDIRFKPYCDLIRKSFNEMMAHQGFDTPTDIGIEIFLNEIHKTQDHGRHCHPNSLFSGVLYLDIPENSSEIAFIDPRPHINFIDFSNRDTRYFVKPKTGLFIMFNSWLEHEVLTNNSETPRISAPFNLYYDRLSFKRKPS